MIPVELNHPAPLIHVRNAGEHRICPKHYHPFMLMNIPAGLQRDRAFTRLHRNSGFQSMLPVRIQLRVSVYRTCPVTLLNGWRHQPCKDLSEDTQAPKGHDLPAETGLSGGCPVTTVRRLKGYRKMQP